MGLSVSFLTTGRRRAVPRLAGRVSEKSEGFFPSAPGSAVQRIGTTEAHQGSPGGCVSKFRPSSGSRTHGCLLRVQMCTVGRSQEVSSSVPPRTFRTVALGLGAEQTHTPQSGQTQRVDTRPLPVVR